MTRRRALALALAAGAALASAGVGTVAHAQGYGTAACSGLALTATVAAPGDTDTLSTVGSPCANAGANGAVSFASDPVFLGNLTADAAGGFSGTFRIPSNATLGSHAVLLDTTLGSVPVRYTAAITIVSGTTRGAIILPTTGQNIALLVLIGIVLIAIGTVLVRFRRRRAKRAAQAEPDRIPEPVGRS